MSSRKQQLIDICFQVGLTIRAQHATFAKKSVEETAKWIAGQLRQCGFETEPCGASWGVLR